jgi:hypothetical protein
VNPTGKEVANGESEASRKRERCFQPVYLKAIEEDAGFKGEIKEMIDEVLGLITKEAE